MSEQQPAQPWVPAQGHSHRGSALSLPSPPHTDPHPRAQHGTGGPILLTEGTSGESVRVRPSRSAARLLDTTVGGDTGWALGGVTVDR